MLMSDRKVGLLNHPFIAINWHECIDNKIKCISDIISLVFSYISCKTEWLISPLND